MATTMPVMQDGEIILQVLTSMSMETIGVMEVLDSTHLGYGTTGDGVVIMGMAGVITTHGDTAIVLGAGEVTDMAMPVITDLDGEAMERGARLTVTTTDITTTVTEEEIMPATKHDAATITTIPTQL